MTIYVCTVFALMVLCDVLVSMLLLLFICCVVVVVHVVAGGAGVDVVDAGAVVNMRGDRADDGSVEIGSTRCV